MRCRMDDLDGGEISGRGIEPSDDLLQEPLGDPHPVPAHGPRFRGQAAATLGEYVRGAACGDVLLKEGPQS